MSTYELLKSLQGCTITEKENGVIEIIPNTRNMKDLIIGELVAGWTESNPKIVTVGRLKRKLTSGGYRIVDNPVIFSGCCKLKDFDFENMKPKSEICSELSNFNEGDFLYCKSKVTANNTVSIFDKKKDGRIYIKTIHFWGDEDRTTIIDATGIYLDDCKDVRLATHEEARYLLYALSESGKIWNQKTMKVEDINSNVSDEK